MSEQRLSTVFPSDPVGRLAVRVRWPLLAPPLAALLYPFLLEAFHAGLAPVIAGQSSDRAARIAVAVAALVLAFAMPIVGLLGAMSLGAVANPGAAQRRASGVALLSVAAPPLFVFLGVVLYMLRDPVPDVWIWAAFWLGALALSASGDSAAGTPSVPRPAPARLRVAHGISALGIVAVFLALHIANHLTFILGPATYREVMKAVRHVYRAEAIEPLLVALFLFQVGSGVFLATRASSRPMDRFRTFQVASGIFLAAYVLGHMNSVFVFARLYLGIDTDWGFATGAPAGLVKDAWNIRLVPHYGLGIFFVLSHIAAGARAVMLSHGVRRRFADRFLIGSATLAAFLACVILLGMCGGRLSIHSP